MSIYYLILDRKDTADYLVNEGNVRYVAMGIDDVVRTVT